MKRYLLSTLLLTVFCAGFIVYDETHAEGKWVAPPTAMVKGFDYSSPKAFGDSINVNLQGANGKPVSGTVTNNMINAMTSGEMSAPQLSAALLNGTADVSVSTGTTTSINNTAVSMVTGEIVSGNGMAHPTYSGPTERVTITVTDPNTGEKTIYTADFKPDCGNFLGVKIEKTPPTPPPPGDGGGGDCDCVSDAIMPAPESKPPDAPIKAPGNISAYGFASAIATVKRGSLEITGGGGNIPTEEDGIVRTFTQQMFEEFFGSSGETLWAKPGDKAQIEVHAKAASIPGYTEKYEVVKEQSDLPNLREITSEDVGKVFTGIAHAEPISASLSWTPKYSSYIKSYDPIVTNTQCPYIVRKTCYSYWTDDEGVSHSSSYDCSYTAYESCSFISGWKPIPGQYISGWDDHLSHSGSVTKTAEIRVPFNYGELDPCTVSDTIGVSGDLGPDCGRDPSIKKCSEVPPYRCGPDEDWPNYGIAYAGEDRTFSNTVTVKPVYSPELDQTYATNTKPTTYEIISFVTTPDSKKPGGAGEGNYYGSKPAPGASCSHYTAPAAPLARGCVVVQREEDIYFNTDLHNSNHVEKMTENLFAYSARDINGNVTKSLDPSIIIDDLPIGSKICVALSVWPSSSHNGQNDSNGAALNANSGGNWAHGAPYCLTIAKKPNTQFWGADIYSAGDITTSQSIKANGFTASGNENSPTNGLSSNDPNRRAFGSWNEYAVISGSTVKNIGSGASLGYEGPFGKTNPGLNGSSLPGGFPTTYTANFTSSGACAYSRQTIANGVNRECQTGTILGNSNIVTNTGLTLDRLYARYSTVPRSSDSAITPTGTCPSNSNLCAASPDGHRIDYASDSANVTLQASSGDTINVPQVEGGRTITITVPGKLTIASNIIYEDTTYTNISDLPQVIIFADSIDIQPQVFQIDAWLIAGQKSTVRNPFTTGVLNTCTDFTIGSDLPNGSVNACDNKPLTIHGPVFANKLLLNRTAGAGQGYDSINPAEHFNLRADSYLWSYAQAQRYSQAVVTYTRELAPRY